MHKTAGVYGATVLGVIAVLVFIIQPGYVQALVERGGLAEVTAGYVASAEMAGIAVVTLLMSWLAHRTRWRPLLVGAILLEVAGNLASMRQGGVEWLIGARFVAGLGAGALASLSFAAIGQTKNPDRAFGFLIVWILTYGAVGLGVLPSLLDVGGLGAFYLVIALLALTGLLCVPHMPDGGEAGEPGGQTETLSQLGRVMAVASIFVFFLGCGVLWAYLSLLGVREGLSSAAVAAGLSASQVAGIVGALGIGLVGATAGRFAPLIAGILICALATAALVFVGPQGALLFAGLVCLFNFAWNAVQPLYLSVAADCDARGRLIMQMVAAQMVGLAGGPFLGATLVAEGGLGPVIWWSSGLLAAGAFLIAPVFVERRRSQPRGG